MTEQKGHRSLQLESRYWPLFPDSVAVCTKNHCDLLVKPANAIVTCSWTNDVRLCNMIGRELADNPQ